MRTTRLASAALALTLIAPALPAGDLNPPPGPVAPTSRKTLSQATTPLPLTITQPGSYVLTSDLTGVPGANGIVVAADDVEIDLNGFSIVGVPGAMNGVIDLDVVHHGFVLKNGAIHHWPERAVEITEFHGARCENLSIHNNSDGLISGTASVIIGSAARDNSGVGFWITEGGMITNCSARNCGTAFYAGHGATVTSCNAYDSATGFRFDFDCVFQACGAVYCGDGFYGESGTSFADCSAQKCGRGFRVFDRCTFSNCAASATSSEGFLVEGAGNVLTGCGATDNPNVGFWLGTGSTATGCTATRNQDGFYAAGEGNRFQSCTADQNSMRGFHITAGHCAIVDSSATRNGAPKGNSQGIYVGGDHSTVSNNHVSGNLGRGVWIAGSFAALVGNTASGNGDDGITIDGERCRLEGNHATANNASGFAIYGSNNLLIRNSAGGNTGFANFFIGNPSTIAGPIETAGTILTATNPNSNIEQ